MIRKRTILIIILLSLLLGWAVGYMRLPEISSEYDFLRGVLSASALCGLCYLTLVMFNRFSTPPKIEQRGTTSLLSRNYLFLWGFFISIILLLGVAFFHKKKQQEEEFLQLKKEQKSTVERLTALLDSVSNHQQLIRMGPLLSDIQKDIRSSPERSLSDINLQAISTLSFGFKPYPQLTGDSISAARLSPGRGQLLLALSAIGMDSISFANMRQKTSFAYADLKKAGLQNINLRFADLRFADFSQADLSFSDFSQADMRDARFWGADLQQAIMDSTDLKRTNFSWANLNGAHLDRAELNGAIFKSTQLKNARLRNIRFRWGTMEGALFNNSDLTGANLAGTDMSRTIFREAKLNQTDLRYANLTQADLGKADLRKADIKFAPLTEANLDDALLDSLVVDGLDWLERLDSWQVGGREKIKKRYRIIADTTTAGDFILIRDE